MNEPVSFRPLLVPSLFLILVGWGGIAVLVLYTQPMVWMRWALFAFLFMALTGTSLPIMYFFHQRFLSEPPAGTRVIVRQAQWVAIYGLVLLWLRWGNLLSLWLTLGLAGGLFAIEWLLRLRERSQWRPPSPPAIPPAETDTNDQSA